MVNIPVSLINATKKQSVSFNQLRKSDYSRIKYKKVANDGEEVPADEIVKGYEVSPDRYVVITEKELDDISPKASRVVEISDFVKLEQIDPRHYDASYYIVPGEGAGKAYALLLESMKESNVVGIAKLVKHQKEYLAAIRPVGNALTLSTMLFADEIVQQEAINEYLPLDVGLSDKELNMARTLIKSQVTDFDAGQYKNEYQQQVMELINKKAEGELIIAEAQSQGNKVIDLMSALEASLAAIDGKKRKKKKASGE